MRESVLKPRGARQATSHPRRRAIVLVIVLVSVLVLSLAAYTFSDLMLAHHEAVQLSGRQIQALALVDSGVDVIRNYLLNEEAIRLEMGGHVDNPALFQAIPVKDDIEPSEQGNVSILSPLIDLDGNLAGVRFGLEDESARLNLNALLKADQAQPNGGRIWLMNLPGMTEDVADAIMDWMDDDDEPRDYGAEVEHYSSLSPPYAPKNGPFESIEELLLVRGVSPELLYGLDTNRNGILDPHEQSGSSLAGGSAGGTTGGAQPNPAASGTLGSLDRGWVGYLTLHSKETNLQPDGQTRINLNGDDLQMLYDDLSAVFSPDKANFIVAYRLFGQYAGAQQLPRGSIDFNDLDLTQAPEFTINNVLDLVGSQVQVPGQQDGLGPEFLDDPAERIGYLPVLMENTTITADPIPGRINIFEAPREILAGIPGMTEEILEALLERRADPSLVDDPNRKYETWLWTQGLVTTKNEMRSLMPFVNAGGDVYRAQVVGYFEDGAASARAEVVIDATAALPRVVFWRDMSHLGRGYPLEVLGVRLVDGL